jgi:hypothetical protein
VTAKASEKPLLCVDGTPIGSCSPNFQLCDEHANLVDKCSFCGCPEGRECQPDGSCACPAGFENALKGGCFKVMNPSPVWNPFSTITPQPLFLPTVETRVHSRIENGVVYWDFQDTRGNPIEWTMPIDTYKQLITTKTLALQLITCPTCDEPKPTRIIDYRTFVSPQSFEKVISALTDGRTDREFVDEVFNLKKQLVVYQVTNEQAQWPLETLTEGRGSCRDTAVLMASLLWAGNQHASYGMKLKLVTLDSNNPTSPRTLNHELLLIEFADGTKKFLETTLNQDYSELPPQEITGYYLDYPYQACANGIPYSDCLDGWFCNSGALVPACQQCGCPTSYACFTDGYCRR